VANVTPPPLDPLGFHDLSAGVNNGDLGTNDFLTLPNGIYYLELIVRGGWRYVNGSVICGLSEQLHRYVLALMRWICRELYLCAWQVIDRIIDAFKDVLHVRLEAVDILPPSKLFKLRYPVR
jgi:hypothetical protein